MLRGYLAFGTADETREQEEDDDGCGHRDDDQGFGDFMDIIVRRKVAGAAVELYGF